MADGVSAEHAAHVERPDAAEYVAQMLDELLGARRCGNVPSHAGAQT